MKIASAERSIDRVNTNTERQFTIKATGKAFRILSSGLYSDKILAIIRELSCNAYDAHIAVGRGDLPFDVHLPTPLEPWFSVRDYGPALSPDQINTVFTTYFESTKTDDNSQIGGLGLGCKSPLSYVDAFTVTSIWEGTERTYTVFFDETDTPSISLMTEEKSNAATGLEVKVSVKPYDYHDFTRKAGDVFRFFPTQPNITGDPSFKINHPEVRMEGDDYILSTGGRGSFAIMGTVVYPFDSSSMNAAPMNFIQRRLIDNGGCFIRFPVGDLDITAGREELSYIPSTSQRIVERVNGILRDMVKRTTREFKKCANEFEARKLYRKIVSNSIVHDLFPSGRVPFRGKIIGDAMFRFDQKKFNAVTIVLFEQTTSTRIKQTAYGVNHTTSPLHFKAEDSLCFIIDDLNSRTALTRIRQFFNDDEKVDGEVFLVRSADPQQLADFLAQMDGVRFVKLSELPKAPPKPRPPTSALKLTGWEKTSGNIKRNSWQKTQVDTSAGGIYVRTRSNVVQYKEDAVPDFSDVYRKVMSLQLFDGAKEELYSVPKSMMDKFDEVDGWVDFFDHIRETFIEKMVQGNWANQMAKARAMSAFVSRFNSIHSDIDFLKRICAQLSPDHPLHKFIKAYKECHSNTSFTYHSEIAEILGIQLVPTEHYDLISVWEEVGEQYIMLDYQFSIARWNRDEKKMLRDAVAYVKMVDNLPNPFEETFASCKMMVQVEGMS